MSSEVKLQGVYVKSENVVAREIAGELVIVPLTSGIGDMEDELFSLNDTGRAIWERLDGKASLQEVADLLANDYQDPNGEIRTDVVGLVSELYRRHIVVATSASQVE